MSKAKDEALKRGKDALERLLSSIANGDTPIDSLSEKEIERQVSAIGAEYGRDLKTYEQKIATLEDNNKELLETAEVVNKSKMEDVAKKLSESTGVSTTLILKYGSARDADGNFTINADSMKAYAEETAKVLGLKGSEVKDEDKSKDKVPAGKADFKVDSSQTVGSGKSLSDLSPDEKIKIGLEKLRNAKP